MGPTELTPKTLSGNNCLTGVALFKGRSQFKWYTDFLTGPKWPPLLLFCLVVCGTLLFGPPPYSDPDTYWHLAAGKEILNEGTIPKIDSWSFATDQRWYNLAWLFDTSLALLDHIGGEPLLAFLPAVALSLLLVTNYYLLPLWGVSSPTSRLISTMLSACILIPCGSVRPHLVSCWFILITLALLQISKKNQKQLLWLIPLTILWANTHGSFLLLAPILGAYLLEALLNHQTTRLKALTLTGLAASLCTLLNPLGWEIYQGTLRTLNSSITKYIAEWMPWSVDTTGAFGPLSVLFILALFGTALLIPPQNKPPLAEKILLFSFLTLSLFSIRFFLILAIVATPFLALQLGNRPQKGWAAQLTQYLLCLVLWLTFASCLAEQKAIYDRLWIKTLPQQLDRNAVLTLVSLQPDARVFSSYPTAGAIALYGSLPKHLKHYLDGRVGTAFSEASLQEYIDTLLGKTPLKDLIAKYQITAAILEKDADYHFEQDLIKLGWKKSHENMKYTLYLSPHEPQRP